MFREPSYLAWAIRQHGLARYDLATSGMTPVTMAELLEAAGAASTPLALDDPSAWPRLRSAIAAHLAVSDDTVVATLGTAHAIWLTYASLASPGDEILVEAPTYEPLLRAAEGMGAKLARFDRPRASGYAVDPERVEAAMTSRTKIVAVSNLHNPTGVRIADDTLRELATRVERRGAWLFVDEVYAPFEALVDDDGVWRGSARGLGARVVTAASLTKCYGLGAQRIGWLSGPREGIAQVEATLLSTSGMLPLAHAALGVAAFAALPRLASRARALLGHKRETVASWIEGRRDLAWSAPREGLFAFVHAPGARDLGPTLERALAEESVLVVPGAFFEMPDGFRLAWSAREADLTPGLAALARGLDARPR